MTQASASLMSLHEAIASLDGLVEPVECETIDISDAVGRELAQPVLADRPSPPVDCSAMDGIVIRVSDAQRLLDDGLPVAGEATIGTEQMTLPTGSAMRIFTGGPVPHGAECVIMREWLIESDDLVQLRPERDPASILSGAHIRRQGENAKAGDEIVPAGCLITPAIVGTMASVGLNRPTVRRRVRVALIVTGDELTDVAQTPAKTTLRDSNGPAVHAMLSQLSWIEIVSVERAIDHPEVLRERLAHAAELADCIITTGGVSMGDHDHVPGASAAIGAQTVFHRIAIKPGKPIFVAAVDGGPIVIGLPGNPVSALVTLRRIAMHALAQIGGVPASLLQPTARVRLSDPMQQTSPLTRFPLVQRLSADSVKLVQSKGSGDLGSAARADGFVEVASNTLGEEVLDYYAWSIA